MLFAILVKFLCQTTEVKFIIYIQLCQVYKLFQTIFWCVFYCCTFQCFKSIEILLFHCHYSNFIYNFFLAICQIIIIIASIYKTFRTLK